MSDEEQTKKTIKTHFMDYRGAAVEVTEAEGKYLSRFDKNVQIFELAWLRCSQKHGWSQDLSIKKTFIEGWNSAVFLQAQEFISVKNELKPIQGTKNTIIQRSNDIIKSVR